MERINIVRRAAIVRFETKAHFFVVRGPNAHKFSTAIHATQYKSRTKSNPLIVELLRYAMCVCMLFRDPPSFLPFSNMHIHNIHIIVAAERASMCVCIAIYLPHLFDCVTNGNCAALLSIFPDNFPDSWIYACVSMWMCVWHGGSSLNHTFLIYPWEYDVRRRVYVRLCLRKHHINITVIRHSLTDDAKYRISMGNTTRKWANAGARQRAWFLCEATWEHMW